EPGPELCLQGLVVIDDHDYLTGRKVLAEDRSHAIDCLIPPARSVRAYDHGGLRTAASRSRLDGVGVFVHAAVLVSERRRLAFGCPPNPSYSIHGNAARGWAPKVPDPRPDTVGDRGAAGRGSGRMRRLRGGRPFTVVD